MSDLTQIFEGIEFCREKARSLRTELSVFVKANVIIRDSGKRHSALPGLTAQMPWSMYNGFATREPASLYRSGSIDATLVADIPGRFGRETGMIMNELRAQLDHLANVLARRNGANRDDSSFPILTEPGQLNASARSKIKLLSDQDKDKIWRLQPYEGETGVIAHLHHADIVRKHRQPLGVHVYVSPQVSGNGFIGQLAGGETGPLTRRGQSIHVASYRDVSLNLAAEPTVHIVEPGEMQGIAAIWFLDEAANIIERIVQEFR